MSKMKYLLSPLFLAVSGAYGATVTVNDPFCTAYSLTNGAADSMVVTCTAGSGTTTPPPPPPPPPPQSTNLCKSQGFDKTLFVNWDWTSTNQFGNGLGHIDTQDTKDMAGGHGLGTNGAIVIQFTTTGPANSITGPWPRGQVVSTPYPANSFTGHTVSISTKPCDFTPADVGGYPSFQEATGSSNIWYTVGPAHKNGFTGNVDAISLDPGATYYVNISTRHFSGTSYYSICWADSTQNCELRITPFKPAGH